MSESQAVLVNLHKSLTINEPVRGHEDQSVYANGGGGEDQELVHLEGLFLSFFLNQNITVIIILSNKFQKDLNIEMDCLYNSNGSYLAKLHRAQHPKFSSP